VEKERGGGDPGEGWVTSWCFGSVSQWKEGERKVVESGEKGRSGCCWEKERKEERRRENGRKRLSRY